MIFGLNMRGKVPQGMQSRREIAQMRPCGGADYLNAAPSCKRCLADGCSSKRASAHCQHRYPSPCRFALSQSRPAYLFWGLADCSAAKRKGGIFGVELTAQSSESAYVNKTNKGSIPCLTLSSSSQPLRPLRCQPVQASTPMASAPSSAQASAVWPVRRSTVIAPQAHLSAQLVAHWPTTSRVGTRQFPDQAACRRLIHPRRTKGACARPHLRRVSAPLKHHQGAISCATYSKHFPFSPSLALPPVQARSRHPHQWPNLPWLTPWKRQHRLFPLSATPTAIAPRRVAKLSRLRATDITKSRRRGLPPVAVLRSKEPSHV